jgi:multiple sugar transport system substrate-binding protein
MFLEGYELKFRRSFLQLAALLFAAAAVLPACSSSGTAKDEPKASDSEKPVQPQPITLKVMNGLYNDKDWQTIVVEPLKKKFPHITLDQGSGVARTYDQKFLEETIAAGNTPDIVLSGVAQSSLMVPLGLAQDLAPFIKKYRIDMNPFDSTTVETLKKYSPIFNMETVTLPLYINFKVLLYNKDLFDKFAVPYPKNHMTHNDAIELSKKLTRMDGGIQYYGYAADSYINLGGQYSLNYIERQTNKVNLSGLEKVFPILKEAMSIPGMQGVSATKAFNTDKTLAMHNEWLASVVQNAAVYKDMKWGMVTYPEFKDRPYQTEVDFHSSYMTKTTKYPDEAFQVISWMMQSEEIQSLITRSGKVTVLKNKEITSLWGKDSGLGTEEALKAILETKMAPSHDVHPLDRKGTVIAPLGTAYTAYMDGTKDLNVALRDAADEMQKVVNTELGK